MNTVETQFDIRQIEASWQALDAMVHLHAVRTDEDYDRMVALMNALLDVAGDDEDHPLSGLLDLVSDLVSRYEQEHYAIEAVEPREALRFLIEARGLKQGDLSAILPQSNLSAILAGNRKISATLAGKLAKFFGVSSALFVPA